MAVKNIKDVAERLMSLGIPFANGSFNNPIAPPFACYTVPSTRTIGGDSDRSALKERSVTIELYTDIRDYDMENVIDELFNDCDLSESSEYIESESMNVTYFEFTFIEK